MSIWNGNMVKKRKLPRSFPCNCGHSKRLHECAGPPMGDEWCNGEGKNTKYFSSLCDCESYIPNNLKYLEQCLKKKRGKQS